jgi:hypothetical protein
MSILGGHTELQKATVGSVMSVCLCTCVSVPPSVCLSVCNNSDLAGQIFAEFYNVNFY